MRATVPIGPYTPDRQDTGSSGLIHARNVVRVADGYSSVRGPKSVNRGSLDAECAGAYSGRTQNGQNFVVAGTESKLFVATTGNLTDESGAAYSVGSDGRWEFELYGNKIIATNYADAIQVFEVGVSATFGALSADAPFAKHLAVIGEFVMAGNIVGRGVNAGAIQTLEAGVQWSAIGDETSWPQVGTDAAVAVQSDFQPFPDDGGEITAMRSGSEWGLIFRERETLRAEYVGGDQFFSFEKVDPGRGCIVPGAAISVGQMTYFPSQEGFMACDGSRVVPIGHEKIDRTWRAAIDMTRRFRVSTARSPELRCVFWLFPEAGLAWAYNYELNEWSDLVLSAKWLLSAMPLDTTMDTAPYATQNVDTTLGAQNMDELLSASVAEFGAFDTSHNLVTFTSDSYLPATLITGDLGDSGRTLVRWIRPKFQGSGSMYVSVASKLSAEEEGTFGTIAAMNSTGVIPLRSGGRYHRALFLSVGQMESFKEFDVELAGQGDR